ncbi:MAG: helix-turn-helix transcriptional regulator [Alphaproteobacteria bacterium]|nr:helix-turn-helix transcriptional regulator [Alphaproteobacteria bacterium]
MAESVRPHAAHAPVVYKTFVPPRPFDAFIENFWYWRGFDPGHAKDTVMASGRLGLLINLDRDELLWFGGERYAARNALSGIALCGTHTQSFAINAYQPHMMGVQFKPGGAFAFFGGSAREFADVHVSLAQVWGADAQRLHQRVVQAPTPGDRIDILFRAFAARFNDATRHPAVEIALRRFARSPHRVSVATVAREAEVSPKTLIRLFGEEVGMTPKSYLRVARFQQVIARVHAAPSVDWMEVVERHGYYDQPHFIREFKEFSGFTPSEYFRLRGPYLQHVPLEA